MPTKLCKWGNSLGVRLPQYVVERTAVQAGDYLFIRLNDAGDIVIRACKARDIPAGFVPGNSPPKITSDCPTSEEIAAQWYSS